MEAVITIIVLLILGLSQLRKKAADDSGSPGRSPEEPRPWINPWNDDHNETYEEYRKASEARDYDPEIYKESALIPDRNRPDRTPDAVDPSGDGTEGVPRRKRKGSPFGNLPKEEWKRGIILKEILDAPRSRRPRQGFRGYR
ncbi:hypothetical protein [Paludifilum halophilum]|uniref:Uncharacterized protein n=1 Tax=Paludifilum halophilum TaxID=1642702 RepID=A0A235B7U9_9BACL|nr:hypothetical protein [Paludifilum halophilum]OYD07665.1 hypothetical protein CHM34_09295 [Paludifilum halophilum]